MRQFSCTVIAVYCNHTATVNATHQVSGNVADGWSAINSTMGTWLSPVTLTSANARCVGNWSLVAGSELSADTYGARSHQLANAGRFCKAISRFEDDRPASVVTEFCWEWFSVGVTRIESNQNRDFGLKIESKLVENQNLEIVTSLMRWN